MNELDARRIANRPAPPAGAWFPSRRGRTPLAAAAAAFAAFVVAAYTGPAGAVDVPPEGAVPWIRGDPAAVDAAFAQARRENKPLLLYWGATWCPPCNQVKATVFNRQDFAERARYFVPVYLDGDSAGAQKLGDRFGVSGYPTMILFAAGGVEVTRLPGEVDAERYMQVLSLGLDGGRPVKDVLAAALAGDRRLRADDWRMLAYYSWDTADERLVGGSQLAATLRRLAAGCPRSQPDLAARLSLRALVAAAVAPKPATAGASAPIDRTSALSRVDSILDDTRLARDNFDLVAGYPAEITALLTPGGSPARSGLVDRWDRALDALGRDPSLSLADRVGALVGRIQLARLAAPAPAALPQPLRDEVLAQATAADRAASGPYERQAVIPEAADALAEAGLVDDADAMLKAELGRSHAAYYLMLGLAGNARLRGDTAAALDWDEKAFAAAVGPATRLQWGSTYVRALLRDAPQDEPRIERALAAVLGELEPEVGTFHDRNRRALRAIATAVAGWSKDRRHDAALQRIRARLDEVCARLPAAAPERATCRGVLPGHPA